MGKLFNLRLTLTRYLSLVLTLLFFLSVTTSHAATIHKDGKRTYVLVKAEKIGGGNYADVQLAFVFIAPEITVVPAPHWVDYSYPASDGKPDNINYQPIKQRSLGLIIAQMNI